jgi:lipoate---protein ligase
MIHFLDLTLPTSADNLALDEALLLDAEEHGPSAVLRLWEWPGCAVVLGAGCRLAEDVNESACAADHVPVLRRTSGGGTVLLNTGCLCYSLVLPYHFAAELAEIRSSYCFILSRLQQGLSDLVPEAACAGTSDLAAGERKFSGNAQQRKRTHLLHHGTLLYKFDLNVVERYLRIPARQPVYRESRAHAAFLMNLPASGQELKERLRRIWQAEQARATWPKQRVAELVEKKYSQPEWTRRR